MTAYGPPLFGGMLIGAAAMLLLLGNGRIAGISGIVARLLRGSPPLPGVSFVIGLMAGPLLYRAAYGQWPVVTVATALPRLVVAGLLVGFGTRMGSGCTSGHGIIGLARFSRRSVAATFTFFLVAVVTATVSGR